jgi:Tol biopolymer transport system component
VGTMQFTRLTGDRNDIAPSWSPDGTLIAYMSTHDGNWEVYTLKPEGSMVRRCTVNPSEDVMPTWAPNGSAILFESNRDGNWGLYLMEPDGSNQRKVLDLGPDHPSWLREQLSWAQ